MKTTAEIGAEGHPFLQKAMLIAGAVLVTAVATNWDQVREFIDGIENPFELPDSLDP